MNGENSDWLSNLPDCVLVDILSKLKAREVVQTFILSKRWLKLWTFVPCLYFNSPKFKAKNTSENEERSIERFENFVSTLLRLRDDDTNLDSFTLCDVHFDRDKLLGCAIGRWILYASTHNPKKLHINLMYLHANSFIHLPDCLFTCKSLEDLHISFSMQMGMRYYTVKIKPDNVCLPRLKKLYLGHASLDDGHMKKLILGCPALESLSLYWWALDMDRISFHNLKKLYFVHCYFIGGVFPLSCTISAPGPEYLHLTEDIGANFNLLDMSTVMEAEISTTYDQSGMIGYHPKLLSGLSGV